MCNLALVPEAISGRSDSLAHIIVGAVKKPEAYTQPVPGDRKVDQALVERAQRGDKRAFDLLIRKYQGKVIRLLARFVRDGSEVEDIAQEAFIKAYRALPGFRGESAFYTWLYRIAINTARNYVSARRVITVSDAGTEDDEHGARLEHLADLDTPESALASKQIAETIDKALQNLPAELRGALTFREVEGLDYHEIARIMSCPVGTVRSRIFRAREAIAKQLRPHLDMSPSRRW